MIRSLKRKFLLGLAILCFSLPLCMEGWAQTAGDVAIDGQVLFSLPKTTDLSAKDRVDAITERLQSAIQDSDEITVTVRPQQQRPYIYLNNEPLFQVYPEDVPQAGISPFQQAYQWADSLESSLQEAQHQRSQGYLKQAVVIALVLVAIAGFLHWLMGRVWALPVKWLLIQLGTIEKQSDPCPQNWGIFLGITKGLARLGLWFGTLLAITSLFPLTREISILILQGLWTGLSSPFLTLGPQSYSLQDVLALLIIWLGLLLAVSFITNLISHRFLPKMGIGRGAIEVITLCTRYSLITLGTIILLQVWGLNLSSLTIVGSALGVGIGFGLQGIAKNLISGLVLLFERSVQVGDLIQVGEYIGVVERVSARNLIIKTLDRISIIVPTSIILEDIVVNWSHDSLTSRLHIPIGVAYGTELGVVKELLLKAADDHSKVLKNPPPDVVFKGFGESSLDFELLIWVNQPSRELFIKSDLLFHIDALFRKHTIEIPFPQRDLNIKSGRLP
ncbi:MAG: mechanosensitive ion channel [Acaryochloridaceae cyanobacterium RL_2_7]|nr:mechanosensitive ion channel [Acaryochloridaceae cyanobacterium RL_2_7]